jgi:uncharacterized small protein (DUF1192 family)
MQQTITTLSAWRVIQDYLQHSKAFICPCRFNDVRRRGLQWVIEGLSGTLAEREAQAYARLLAKKLVYGDEEIDEIAHVQKEIRRLQAEIAATNASELIQLRQLGAELQEYCGRATAYFK